MAIDFGELQRRSEVLKDVIERQESRVRYHERRAQNITMAYLIWERSFFFAILQAPLLKCIDWWVILGLSLSCAFVYFLFFLEAVLTLYRLQCQMDEICKKQTEICQQIMEAITQFYDVEEPGDSSHIFRLKIILELGALRIAQTKLYICSTVSALLAVTAVELFASWFFLCN